MKSIIFDLDCTLWDSRQTIAEAWTEAIQHHIPDHSGFTKEDIGNLMGLQIPVIAEKLFPDETLERRKQLMGACAVVDQKLIRQKGGKPFDDLEATLKLLAKQHDLYIVSNCEDGYIEAFYEAHGLESYFKDYENPGRTGLSKGENILLVMERNAIEQAVYVGDTQGDLDAARRAGIPFIFASYGFGTPEDYDEKITTFKELVKLMGVK
ncbi:HAD family hydrolase [Chryseomicrobium palamuruense]